MLSEFGEPKIRCIGRLCCGANNRCVINAEKRKDAADINFRIFLCVLCVSATAVFITHQLVSTTTAQPLNRLE